MEFKLFLKEINQEMIDAGRLTLITGQDGWNGNVWSKECCIINFSKAPGEDLVRPLRNGLLMRAEHDGGLIWSPSTNAVYKVDEEAYRVLLDLNAGLSERYVAKRHRVALRSVKELIEKANKATSK